MKFKKGDRVQLKKEAIEEGEKTGRFECRGMFLRGIHTVKYYWGNTMMTDLGVGFHNEDELELVE